ncbi:MAG: hypothetical protein AAB267_06075 [Candidatus Desantisbacteria bacterium]
MGATAVMRSKQLNLPEEIARRLRGKEVEFLETKEGILIKPLRDTIKDARGSLKESSFSSERYMWLKEEEKKLEN